MSNNLALTSIESIDLERITGGTGPNVNADIKLDASQTVRDVGNGVGRVLGCATGASDLREFGNCILTGHLGGVPPASTPTPPPSTAPAAKGKA